MGPCQHGTGTHSVWTRGFAVSGTVFTRLGVGTGEPGVFLHGKLLSAVRFEVVVVAQDRVNRHLVRTRRLTYRTGVAAVELPQQCAVAV